MYKSVVSCNDIKKQGFVNLSLRHDYAKKLKDLAKYHQRSMAGEIRYLIEKEEREEMNSYKNKESGFQ